MQEGLDGVAKRAFGMTQGGLSPREDGRLQAFPRETWRDEFVLARELGLDYVEWIHDAYGEGKDKSGRIANPIFSQAGLVEFDALKAEHGVATPSLRGDWFTDIPLVRCSPMERNRRESHLHWLMPVAVRMGAKHIVLPFVDNSRIKGEYEKQAVVDILKRALRVAEKNGVELHVETDFPAAEFAAFLERVSHPLLKVSWDSGRSAGLGYVAAEEFAAYGDRVGSVRIRDAKSKDEGAFEVCELGSGAADFDNVSAAIARSGYSGGFTVPLSRGGDADPGFIGEQLSFVKRRLSGE